MPDVLGEEHPGRGVPWSGNVFWPDNSYRAHMFSLQEKKADFWFEFDREMVNLQQSRADRDSGLELG
jgi:hypothetical protein